MAKAAMANKELDEIINAVLARAHELPECSAPTREPCRHGDLIYLCHFVGGSPCRTCGADKPGGEGCRSISFEGPRPADGPGRRKAAPSLHDNRLGHPAAFSCSSPNTCRPVSIC